jgi:ATP-dependent Clp protease ATP-binding subunit ClpA
MFLFQGLEHEEIVEILRRQLNNLRNQAELRGLQLEWETEVFNHLTAQWEPRYGVRHLLMILRNRIVEHLSIAEVQGELEGVKKIFLDVASEEGDAEERRTVGRTYRELRGDTLAIVLT